MNRAMLRPPLHLLAGLLLVIGCDSTMAPGTDEERPSIETQFSLSPYSLTLSVGESAKITPQLTKSPGTTVNPRSLRWESTSSATASVDRDGVVSGAAGGSALIIARSGSVADTTRVRVVGAQQVAKSGVSIVPDTVVLAWLGATAALQATAYDANGTLVANPGFTWKSLSPAIAAADDMGVITAKAAGVALIVVSATCCGQADTAHARVQQVVDSVSIGHGTLASGPGAALQFTPHAWDRGGAPVPGVAFAWTSDNAGVASVSADGLVSLHAVGTAMITLAAGALRARVAVSVENITPPPANSVELQLVRMDRGSGKVLVSTGVPLAPGMLRRGQEGQVRLIVAGKEQPIYAEVLHGRHRDGSARAVLVQVEYSLGTTPVPATLVLGQARGTASRPKASVAYTYDRPLPAAVLLPTSVNYLLSTGIIQATVPAPNSFNQAYETRFVEQSAGRFSNYLAAYEGGTLNTGLTENYYDRVLGHIAYWVRTGDADYWKRAFYYLMGYRELFLMPPGKNSPCQVDPRNQAIEGLELHYLLTGDEASRACVQRMASQMASPTGWLGIMDTRPWDSRVKSRIILALFTAWRLDLTSLESRGPSDFAVLLREAVDRTLRSQSSNGGYYTSNVCGGTAQINYMTAIINESLAKVYQHFEPDPRIPPAIRRAVDHIWTSWVPESGAFLYRDGPCTVDGGDPSEASDLNMLIVHNFGWVYHNTGVTSYRDRGDLIFREGVRRTWFGNSSMSNGDKQFNQHYRSSFQYLYHAR
jgi:hypothetical protein